MKAKAIGRFVAEFLEGFLETNSTPEEPVAAAVAPMVIPTDAVRAAVADFLGPLLQDETPSAKDLDLFTSRIEDESTPVGDIAEQTLRRVHEVREREAEARERERNGHMPEGYHDPNLPSSTGWASPRPA